MDEEEMGRGVGSGSHGRVLMGDKVRKMVGKAVGRNMKRRR